MNKKMNTLLFIAAATIANIVIMVVLYVVTFILYARFLAELFSPLFNQIMLIVLFVSTVAATYVIYRALVKWVSGRIDMKRYFEPLFRIRK